MTCLLVFARRLSAAIAVTLAATAGACAAPPSSATSHDDIIGGEDAAESALDAVARFTTPKGSFCTGTLVAPRLVLTAAHCVEGYDGRGQERPMSVYFGAASNFDVRAVLRFGAEERPDGSLPFGIDIALLMLEKPVPEGTAKPIPVRRRPLDQDDVGKTLLEVGFGQSSAGEEASWDQPRQKGAIELNAVSGDPYPQVFEDRVAFDAYLTELEGAAFVERRGDELWAESLSEYGQEVQAGGRPSEPQGCYGDSGAPLLEKTADGYRVVAVASNGPEGDSNPCILGEKFVRAFDQVVAAVAERASSDEPWGVRSCPDAEPRASYCAAEDLAVECRASTYGTSSTLHQRIERCRDRGLTCSEDGGGGACE